MAILRHLDSSGNTLADYRLDGKTEVWIGRTPDNDIVLASSQISRRHARVIRTERGHEIVDNDSQNGIVVAGLRVRSHTLRHGDVVVLGHEALQFIGEAPPVPQPPPVPAPARPAPARGGGCRRKGCVLGCLSVPLAGLALLFALYVWWVRPPWMARFMVWRKPLNPQLELRISDEDVARLAEQEKALAAMREARAESARMSGLRTGSYVRKSVSAARGETLTTREGATLRIPPGALARDAVVELAPRTTPSTPQLKSGWTLLSDVWMIRVDGREHSTFNRPLTLEVPVALRTREGKNVAPEALRALSWDGSSWKQHPSRVATNGTTARFEIRHASDGVIGMLETGVNTVGRGVGMVTGTGTELGPWVGSARFARYPAHRTEHFVIYYVPPGDRDNPEDAVIPDAEYKPSVRRKPAGVPWFVLDLADALEHAYDNAPRVGVRPEDLWAERIAVFVENSGSFGESPLGGPIYINNRMIVDPDIDWTEFVMTTAAHEMMHVVQDEYFQWAEAGWSGALIEITAEALGELLRYRTLPRQHPSPYFTIRQSINQTPHFLSKTVDSEGRGEKVTAYAWATFFIWAEVEGGLPNFTSEVMKTKASWSGFASVPKTMAAVVPRIDPSQNLSALFVRFANAYLHDDLWEAKFHSREWWDTKARSMTGTESEGEKRGHYFCRPNSRNERVFDYHFSRRAKGLDHLTARLDLFNAEFVRNDVPGKAYVRFYDVANPGARVFVYADRMLGPRPDPSVPRSEPAAVQVTGGEMVEIRNFGNHAETPGRLPPNELRLVIINDQPAVDGLDFSYDAWLLLPPAGVQFDRMQGIFDAGGYKVTWIESPLQKSAELFRGYNVYRRRRGETQWPAGPLNPAPIKRHELEDWPQEKVDHEYAVTVVDAFGHESEKSLVETDDPFIGEWSGSLTLKGGTLIDVSKVNEKVRQEWGPILALLQKGEFLLRMGVPVRFRLERLEGKYFIRPARFLVFNAEDVDPAGHFVRVSKNNLQFVPDAVKVPDGQDEPSSSPIFFSLEYPNEIHNIYVFGQSQFEWRLTRDEKSR